MPYDKQNLHDCASTNSNESERRFFLANMIRHFQKKSLLYWFEMGIQTNTAMNGD